MKYVHYIPVLVMGLITSFLIWIYSQRANLDYNPEGKHFSLQDNVVYYKKAKEIYGVLALFGLIFTVVFIIRLVKNSIP